MICTVALHHARSGAVHNVCSGVPRRLRRVVEQLIALSGCDLGIEPDASRQRRAAVPVLVGAARKIREATGWSPLIRWEQTLQDVLADARRRRTASN